MILKSLSLICFIILISSSILAQEFSVKKYNTDNGIIDPTVRVISQDSLGRIWIGTAEGLSIYDGNNFTNFSKYNGLNKDVINCFFPINKNTMLVGTNDGGIVVFKKYYLGIDTVLKVINNKKYLAGNSISEIFKDSKNNYWICTNSGISRWRIDNDKIDVKNFSQQDLFGYKEINTAVEMKNGDVLFGTKKGLLKFSNGNFYKASITPYSSLEINLLFLDSKNELWISTSRGLYLFRDTNKILFKNTNKVFGQTVFDIKEDYGKQLWISYTRGLLKYNLSNGQLNFLNQFKDIFCTTMLKDKEGNIWVGNLDGLTKIINNNFVLINNIHLTLGINNVCVSPNNRIIITSFNGMFRVKNDRLIPAKINRKLKDKNIRPLLFQHDSIWAGSAKGVFLLKNNQVLRYFPLINKTDKNFVYSLGKDSDNNILVGTDGGLVIISNEKVFSAKDDKNKGSIYSFKYLKNLPRHRVSAILIDHNHNVWLGYWRNGIYVLKHDGSKNQINKVKELSGNKIRNLYEDSQQNIWICTRYSGVYKYDGNRFVHYTSRDGLGSNFVSAVIQDKYKNYWFGTAKGVAEFDGKNWKRYGASDGITSSGILNIKSDKNDNLYFVCHKGLYLYKSDFAKYNMQMPPKAFINKGQFLNDHMNKTLFANSTNITINSLLSNFRKNAFEKPYTLNYTQNSLQFEFSSNSFKNETKNKFQYMLEGFDKHWSTISVRRYVNYTHLPAGKYKLLVKTYNAQGVASLAPASLSFNILPPYWQRWWFITLSILVAISVISGITLLIYRYRISQVVKMERVRTRIATDLHDDLGTSLSRIAIFSQLAKREIKNSSSKIFDLLEKIETSSRGLIDSMDDIVWSINPDNDSLEDATLKLENFAIELLEAKDIDVLISAPKDTAKIELPLDIRRQFLLVFKEIINNTAKHSKASIVEIIIKPYMNFNGQSKKGISVIVKDNGNGFDIKGKHDGNGLKNIEKRVASLNGTFDLSSSIGQGTAYKLFIPL